MDDVQINVAAYLADKKIGRVRVVKMDGQPLYCLKRYREDTGEPFPRHLPVDRAQIQAFRDQTEATLKQTLDGCDALLSDIDSAQEI